MEASLARRIGASLPAVGIGLALLAGLWPGSGNREPYLVGDDNSETNATS